MTPERRRFLLMRSVVLAFACFSISGVNFWFFAATHRPQSLGAAMLGIGVGAYSLYAAYKVWMV